MPSLPSRTSRTAVRALARLVTQITRPNSLSGLLEGTGAPSRLWALLRDGVEVLAVAIPWIAANRHVLVERALEPRSLRRGDCNCDELEDELDVTN